MIGLAACLLTKADREARPGRPRAPADAVRQAERRGQRRPQPAVPGAVLAVEVAARVALAALVDALRAVLLELGVDQRRDRLVGRRPVAIAAAEDAVLDAGEGSAGSAGSRSHWQNLAALSGGWPL